MVSDAAGPRICGFRAQAFKAFPDTGDIRLGKLTFVLGKNNAGKSSLCVAPSYFARAFGETGPMPFPPTWGTIDFGALKAVCFRRRPTGLLCTLDLEDAGEITKVTIGATWLPERQDEQLVTRLEFERVGATPTSHSQLSWEQARRAIDENQALRNLPSSVAILGANRASAARFFPRRGATSDVALAAIALEASGERGLAAVNEWYRRLGVRLAVEERGKDAFEIMTRGPTQEPVALFDSGAGLVHILPLAVAVTVADILPSLVSVEQPELHLHPRAHVDIAELLLQALQRHPRTRWLIETHSDVLLLRIRREIAAGTLSPEDVRVYFVNVDVEGATVREIKFNERGSPDWWPEAVFGEPQREFHKIRQALAEREKASAGPVRG